MGTLGRQQWTTADGKTLKWSEMELSHLTNIYHLLRRREADAMLNIVAAIATAERPMKLDGVRPAVKQLVDSARFRANQMEAYIKYRVTKEEANR